MVEVTLERLREEHPKWEWTAEQELFGWWVYTGHRGKSTVRIQRGVGYQNCGGMPGWYVRTWPWNKTIRIRYEKWKGVSYDC